MFCVFALLFFDCYFLIGIIIFSSLVGRWLFFFVAFYGV